MAIDVRKQCVDCGQTLNPVFNCCSRCDEICAECGLTRRTHKNIEGYELCATIFYRGTHMLNIKIGSITTKIGKEEDANTR